MRLVSSLVGLVSTYGNKLLLPTTRLTHPVVVGIRCTNNCNSVFNSSHCYLTTPTTFLGRQCYFSTVGRHYFSLACTSRTHSAIITTLTININTSSCYENQTRRRKTPATNCNNTTTPIIRRTYSAKKTGSPRLVNGCCGVRNFNTGRSVFIDSKEERRINISPKKEINKLKLRSPREFMEAHGVKPGDYVNSMLQMTPVEAEQEQQSDVLVFRGSPLYVHPSRPVAFGGCLMGQALSAAVRCVPQGQLVHSFHNYFLNAGRRGSVDYHVKNVRDGNTYCNRFVQAMQNGKNIVNMQVSFKKDETDPFHHQHTMPDCKRPEELVSALKLLETKLSEDLSEDLKKILKERLPIDPVVEFRPLDKEALYRLKPLPPKRLTWLKITEKLGDDENFHRCVMAFLSDYIIITTTLLPNANNLQRFFLTSLDHSIWFHNKVRLDDWLLYETESCHAGGGTGFSTGRFWTQDGVLAASVAQQGVVRSLL